MTALFQKFIGENISIAVGFEDEGWYVQTTDKKADTYYSEPIESGLNTKVEAMAIANHYAERYGTDVIVWDNPDTTIHAQDVSSIVRRLQEAEKGKGKITQEQLDKELFQANQNSENTDGPIIVGRLLIDELDDILYDAIIQMGAQAGYSIKPKDDFTNELLMETRNEIMGSLVGNFHVERK